MTEGEAGGVIRVERDDGDTDLAARRFVAEMIRHALQDAASAGQPLELRGRALA